MLENLDKVLGKKRDRGKIRMEGAVNGGRGHGGVGLESVEEKLK